MEQAHRILSNLVSSIAERAARRFIAGTVTMSRVRLDRARSLEELRHGLRDDRVALGIGMHEFALEGKTLDEARNKRK